MYEKSGALPERRRIRPHPLRQIWENPGVAIAGWCSLPGSPAAEAMATLGWDCVVVDMQHGMIDFSDLVVMLQAIEAADAVAMVRLPWNDVGLAQRVLDIGATGLICPMINTRKECEHFVQACQFPPLGYRSFGGIRSSAYRREAAQTFAGTRSSILVFAMIETRQALANGDEIASVEGLDGIFFGAADFAASCGRDPSAGLDNDLMDGAHTAVISLCGRHGLIPGINASSAAIARQRAQTGYRLIALQSDLGLLIEHGRHVLADARAKVDSLRT